VNPFLQILDVNISDCQKIDNSIIGTFGELTGDSTEEDFKKLINGIYGLKMVTEEEQTIIPEQDGSLPVTTLFGDLTKYLPNIEKTETQLQVDNPVKSVLQNNLTLKPDVIQTQQMAVESDIQRQNQSGETNAHRLTAQNLPAIPNLTNREIIIEDKHNIPTLMSAQNGQGQAWKQVSTPVADLGNILFRADLQNGGVISHPASDGIFNQKTDLLKIREVELTNRQDKPPVNVKVGHNLPTDIKSSKTDFEIPFITRSIPVSGLIKNNLESKTVPDAGFRIPADDIYNVETANRPVFSDSNTAGNDNMKDYFAGNTGMGKNGINKFGKVIETGFAKALSGETIVSSLNETAKINSITAKVEQTTVRFVVPDKILENGSLNNQTITIKMEPEHLGTIRLTLSMLSHGLTGRMVVENSAALLLVESNIDNLFTELSDKGINLDAFQVTVSGERNENKPAYDRSASRMKNRVGKLENSDRPEEVQSVTVAAAGRMYINSGGVNWLA
jgi:hypothetical protein